MKTVLQQQIYALNGRRNQRHAVVNNKAWHAAVKATLCVWANRRSSSNKQPLKRERKKKHLCFNMTALSTHVCKILIDKFVISTVFALVGAVVTRHHETYHSNEWSRNLIASVSTTAEIRVQAVATHEVPRRAGAAYSHSVVHILYERLAYLDLITSRTSRSSAQPIHSNLDIAIEWEGGKQWPKVQHIKSCIWHSHI